MKGLLGRIRCLLGFHDWRWLVEAITSGETTIAIIPDKWLTCSRCKDQKSFENIIEDRPSS